MNKRKKVISLISIVAIVILVLGSWYIRQKNIQSSIVSKEEQRKWG